MPTAALDCRIQAKAILDRIESTKEVLNAHGHLDIIVIVARRIGRKELRA
jgi:hypothetical protein